MSRVEQILELIEGLTDNEFCELEERLAAEDDWRAWDEQIADDHRTGRLDPLLSRIDEDRKNGELLDGP